MNGQTSIITKKQAEMIFENDMMTRDFWLVSDTNDNINILQDVLDKLFNVIEGNNYSAKYSNGQYHSRLIILCGICHKEMTSQDPFVSHDKGKHHKKAVQLVISVGDQLPKPAAETNPSLLFRDPRLPLAIFQEGTLEHRIDYSSHDVIGLQYLYKEDYKGRLLFTCQLCSRNKKCFRIPADQMFDHLTSDFHAQKYMSVTFGYTGGGRNEHSQRVLALIDVEGRISCAIPKFEYYGERNQRPLDESSIDEKNVNMKRERALSPSSPLANSLKRSKDTQDAAPLQSTSPPVSKAVPVLNQGCQATTFSQSISEFVKELRNCVEEESEIKSVVQGTKREQHRVISDAVKVLSKGLIDFFTFNKDEEFERMSRKFLDMTMKM